MNSKDLRIFTGLTQIELGRIFGLPSHTKSNGVEQCKTWQNWEQQGKTPTLAGEIKVNLEQDLHGLVMIATATGKTASEIFADALTFYFDRSDLVKCPECNAPVFDLAFWTVGGGDIEFDCPGCQHNFFVRETAEGYEYK